LCVKIVANFRSQFADDIAPALWQSLQKRRAAVPESYISYRKTRTVTNLESPSGLRKKIAVTQFSINNGGNKNLTAFVSFSFSSEKKTFRELNLVPENLRSHAAANGSKSGSI
jgi:hypothetical protein